MSSPGQVPHIIIIVIVIVLVTDGTHTSYHLNQRKQEKTGENMRKQVETGENERKQDKERCKTMKDDAC